MLNLTPHQLDKITWLLRDCGQRAKSLSSEKFQVFEKGINDYVTTVDRELDRTLSQFFTALFPHDGVITEENPQSRQLFQAGYERLWCIDPIDGTDDFIQGKDHYALMVGLLEAHQPIAGWVYAPSFAQLYCGGPGWGLFQATGDRPLTPLIPLEPAPPSGDRCPMILGYKDRRHFGASICTHIPGVSFHSIGSFGLKVLEVIQGRAGLYVYLNRRVKLWDTVGPLALAQAAGLLCCDLEGNAFRFSADAVDLDSLAHQQFVVIGWPRYVMEVRSRLREAVYQVLEHQNETGSITG